MLKSLTSFLLGRRGNPAERTAARDGDTRHTEARKWIQLEAERESKVPRENERELFSVRSSGIPNGNFLHAINVPK